MHTIVNGVWKRLLAYFLAGIFAVLPLVITALIVVWVVGILNEFFGEQSVLGGGLRWLGVTVSQDGPWPTAIGWLLVLAFVFLLGFAAVEFGARRLFDRSINAVVRRTPLIGSIYDTSRQLVDLFNQQDKEQLKGMSAVFCNFGGERGAGILALLVSPQTYEINGRKCQIVIAPTAPVPFGGALFFVPIEVIEPANMSVDGLMSIYVSMGVTAPQFMQPTAA